jgi:hypothetical protein
MADHELRIQREARFEAARGVLTAHLAEGRRDDGWFRQPGLTGRLRGRDVELRFPGGCNASLARVSVRIRTGGPFSVRPRAGLLQRLGMHYLAIGGRRPAKDVLFAVERLIRDYQVLRVTAGSGLLRADVRWERAGTDTDRVLKVLERLDRIALALEDVHQPLVESGGLLTCPYCRVGIGEEAPMARCESCGTPYHPSCFEESGGCAVYGCANLTARSTSGRIQHPRRPHRAARLKEPAEEAGR